jgi:transglutaminase-like putative cysteine protease
MKLWAVRMLAIALAIVAIYLAVARAHGASIPLECALGAAVLGVLSVALLWKAPTAAAILNVCWLVGAFVVSAVLTRGYGLPGFAGPSTVTESPQAASAQLEQIGKSLLPQDYILAIRAQQLPTIDAAFAYVRDNIRFESYSGILRGAKGTFHARAGNALDRAMLLAAILETNKIPVRIVTGQLPEPLAEQLFEQMFQTAGSGASPAAATSPGGNALTDAIFARAHRDYNTIVSALGDAAPAVTTPSHDDVLKEIERHAWVQAQRNGRWVDLDPSFPDSSVGRSYTSVDQAYGGPPAQLMQQVTIRVATETLAAGALTKEVVLETTLPAYRLIDGQVFLTHQQPNPFNGQGAALQNVFGNKDIQQPVLNINGTTFEGKPIDFGAGASAAGAATPNSVQQAANAFGTPAPNSNAPAFVAEWLEFEVVFPDGRKDVTRRVLVDRAGTAWRHASNLDPARLRDLARNAGGIIALQTLYNVWFSGGKHDLLAFTNVAQSLLNDTLTGQNAYYRSDFARQEWLFAMRDLSWFIVSDHTIVPSINDTPGLRFYADSPRIFVWSVSPDPTGKGAFLFTQSDLRRDTLRGIAKDSSGQAAIAQHKLWFGALEGALEQEMGAPPSPDPASPFVSTSSLADSGDVVVLGPGAGGSVSASDPETQARLQAALASGDTLVVPKQVLAGGSSGWWQIAHDTGDMRAVLDDDLNMSGGGYSPKVPPVGQYGPQRINYANIDQEFDEATKLLSRGLEVGGEEEAVAEVPRASTPAWAYVGMGIIDVGLTVLAIYEAAKL